MNSSRSWVINLAIRVFACPLNPSNKMLCLDNIALSKSGITVSSKPIIPSKTVCPDCSLSIKFFLNSSLTERDLYPAFFSCPSVFIFFISKVPIYSILLNALSAFSLIVFIISKNELS